MRSGVELLTRIYAGDMVALGYCPTRVPMAAKDAVYLENTATIRLDKDLVRDYKAIAVSLDTSVRALAEDALRAYLAQAQKRAEKARKTA